jgi:hypothetical protein
VRAGVDGCYTLSRYVAAGYRQQAHFADQPCRIHTYGNSFTQGHQVSDGETWQEVLAAHFCEPLRNYGVGGFGVYQAYLRLLREESQGTGAPWLIFNIWGDDHWRSLMSWRWVTFTPRSATSMAPFLFHANPWRHARLDSTNGQLDEKPNVCPNPDDLYKLCDREFVRATFADDEYLRLHIAMRTGRTADPAPLESMAAVCQFRGLDLSSEDSTRKTCEELLHAYAARVSSLIFDKLDKFVRELGKKLLVLLTYPQGSIQRACASEPAAAEGFFDWHRPEFVRELPARGIPVLDTVKDHLAEFRSMRMDPKAYVDRYYIGHYNPQGNHFFAFAIKDRVRDWLEPKPPAYRSEAGEVLEQFRRYLPG